MGLKIIIVKLKFIMDIYISTTNNKVKDIAVVFQLYDFISTRILHVPGTIILVTRNKKDKKITWNNELEVEFAKIKLYGLLWKLYGLYLMDNYLCGIYWRHW